MGQRVALIGVGKMGRALLARLLAANHQVKAYDIAEAPMATARATAVNAWPSRRPPPWSGRS